MKNTKKAFIMSMTSMLVCVAMLIGTTFAWFTDSVTSGTNKIVAGNLDINVEYSKDNGATWANLDGSSSLFSGSLWEPGYTEYVTLKVENKGSLAFNYKMLITPVNEKGGVNTDGDSFKLSDYLCFGTSNPSTELVTYTRETALALAGGTTGLSVNSLSKTNTMVGKKGSTIPTQYITLAVAMPNSTTNNVNYKSGTTAPEIELAIKFIATQLSSEDDSFGHDYDAEAVTVSPYNVGATYEYYPQVVVSQPVAANNEDTVIIKNGKLNVADDDSDAVQLAKVIVPAGAVADGIDELTVKVIPQEATLETIQAAGLAVEVANEEREIANYEVKVEGVKSNNTNDITVQLFVGKGLNNVKVYHNGEEISGVTYNSTTGIVEFTTTSFSDYTVAFDKAVAAIGEKTYGSLINAVNVVKNNETIVLLKNCKGDGFVVEDGKTVSINFNGFEYEVDGETVGSEGTKTSGFQFLKGASVTFTNGKITSSKAKFLVQNYSNLTIKDMTIVGTGACKGGISNNCGVVNITGNTSIKVPQGMFSVDAMYWPDGGYSEGAQVTINTTGTIDGLLSAGNDSTVNGMGTTTLSIIAGNFVNYGVDNYCKVAANLKGAFVITGGTFDADPSEYVSGSKFVVEENDVYSVVEGTIVTTEEELNAAIANNTPVIYNITTGIINITGNGCDKTIIRSPAVSSYDKTTGLVIDTKNITISDITINKNPDISAWEYSGVVDIRTGNVTLDGVVINNSGRSSGIVIKSFDSSETITIKDTIVNGGFKPIHIVDGADGTIVMDNVEITGTYTFNVNSSSSQDLVIEVKNSKLHGWTSYGSIASVSFDNTQFSKGNSAYDYLKPYIDTTFTDCTFDEGFQMGSGASGKTYTFTNCYYNGTKLTASNFASYMLDLTDSDGIAVTNCTVIIDGVTVAFAD